MVCPSMAAAAARRQLLRAVRVGLLCRPKRLDAELFLDAEGARLLEQIAALPESYQSRTERSVLEAHADEIAALAHAGGARRVHVVELVAGVSAERNAFLEPVLRALVRRQGRTIVWPAAGARAPLDPHFARVTNIELASAIACASPGMPAHPARATGGGRVMVVLGGAVLSGLDEAGVAARLSAARNAATTGGALLLGIDRLKDLELVLPAYDDARGLNAAWSKRVLVRLNQEVGSHFDVETFAHRVRWNGLSAAVETHLESLKAQRVRLDALGSWVELRRGETIHIGASVKFGDAHLDQLLERCGWLRERTFSDARGWVGVSVCRAV